MTDTELDEAIAAWRAKGGTGADYPLSLTTNCAATFAMEPRELSKLEQAAGISEAASKKRGRPRVTSDWFDSFCHNHFGNIKTARGRQNKRYLYLAIDVLDLHPGGAGLEKLGWLIDWQAADAWQHGAIKAGILCELGRFAQVASAALTCEVAELVCDGKPSVKQGAAFVRRLRMKATSKRDDFEAWKGSKRNDRILLVRLCRAVDQYRTENPEMTTEQVLTVINELYCLVQDQS
jgi:hypothetical protein